MRHSFQDVDIDGHETGSCQEIVCTADTGKWIHYLQGIYYKALIKEKTEKDLPDCSISMMKNYLCNLRFIQLSRLCNRRKISPTMSVDDITRLNVHGIIFIE